jgi:prepilin-type N-terminal cleavage/methylation domain-containing protein
MRNERGMTLIELMLVVAVASLALIATAAYSVPWIAREKMRGAVYDVQLYMQLARIEAVSRNQLCRMVLDTTGGTLEVFDSNGTSNTADDLLLYSRRLPASIEFDRPDSGSAVTLSQIGSTDSYQATFNSNGTVDAGSGVVVIHGAEQYGKVSIFGAGGTQVEKWTNGAWHVGS